MIEDPPELKKRRQSCSCKHVWLAHSNKGMEGCSLCECVLNQAGQGASIRRLVPYKDKGMLYYNPQFENELGERLKEVVLDP